MKYYAALARVYDRAGEDERRAGERWYQLARARVAQLAMMFHVDLHTAAAVVAALSNNMEWEANLKLASNVLTSLSRGERPTGHFPLCLDKATRIVRGDLTALSGPKVVAFAQALAGDDTAAVVDRHMYRAAGMWAWPTRKRHAQVGAALVQLAHDVGEPVTTVQAVVWVVQRNLG